MAWRPAASLLTLHAQLKRGAPRAAPPATRVDAWGLIGDVLHDSTSDHVPHDFPGWGDDIVTAADFPHAPALGLDSRRVLNDIRLSRDSRAKYGISMGEIFSNHAVTQGGVLYPAWTWRPYHGDDPHDTHGHLSVVGDARADDVRPWQTLGRTIMALSDAEWSELLANTREVRDRLRWVDPRVAAEAEGSSTYKDPGGVVKHHSAVEQRQTILSKLDLLLQGASPAPVQLSDDDRADIAARVVQQLADAELVFRVQPA